jgi:hypothetical protein
MRSGLRGDASRFLTLQDYPNRPPVKQEGDDLSWWSRSIERAFRFDRTVLAVDDNVGGSIFLRSTDRRIDSQLFGI